MRYLKTFWLTLFIVITSFLSGCSSYSESLNPFDDKTQYCANYQVFSSLPKRSFDEVIQELNIDTGMYSVLMFDLDNIEYIGPGTSLTANRDISAVYQVYYPDGNTRPYNQRVMILRNDNIIPAFDGEQFLDLELVPGDRVSFDIDLDPEIGLNNLFVLEFDNFTEHERGKDDIDVIRPTLLVDVLETFRPIEYKPLEVPDPPLGYDAVVHFSAVPEFEISNSDTLSDIPMTLDDPMRVYVSFLNPDHGVTDQPIQGGKLGFLVLISDEAGNLVHIGDMDYFEFPSGASQGIYSFDLDMISEPGLYSVFGVVTHNPGHPLCKLDMQGLQYETYADKLSVVVTE